MSFHFEFTAATAEQAQQIVAEEHAPQCVKDFLVQALGAFPGRHVYVRAAGHLWGRDYPTSTCNIEVREVALRVPRVAMPDDPSTS